MKLKHTLHRLIERVTSTRMFRLLPRGVDFFTHLKHVLPHNKINTLFYVGANVGQSALAYAQAYPQTRIFSFEPVPETFQSLKHATTAMPNVRCFCTALGSSCGTARMTNHGTSTMNHLVKTSTPIADDTSSEELVSLATLDSFCLEHQISHISLLKIDTEGHDLDVLRGARDMLTRQAIDVVEAEVGMHPDNDHHVPLEELKSYLDSLGYRLFGIYEQISEWPTGQPHLRRSNTAFISPRMIEVATPHHHH
jgi:FkbM family methyltransferase